MYILKEYRRTHKKIVHWEGWEEIEEKVSSVGGMFVSALSFLSCSHANDHLS